MDTQYLIISNNLSRKEDNEKGIFLTYKNVTLRTFNYYSEALEYAVNFRMNPGEYIYIVEKNNKTMRTIKHFKY